MDTPALYSGFDDPKTQGILAMAAALLQSGGASRYPQGLAPLGAGLQAGLAQMSAAKKEQMQNVLMAQQLAKMKRDQQAQEMFNRMYGPGAASAATGGTAENPSVVLTDAARANLPQAQRGPTLEQIGQLAGIDQNRAKIALDLWKTMNPDIKWEGGIPLHPRTGQPLTNAPVIPQTNQQGFSIMNVPDGRGGFSVQQTPGGLAAFLAQQRAAKQAESERELVTLPPAGPGLPPRMVSKESIIQAGGVVAGMSPEQVSSHAAASAQQTDIAKAQAEQYNNWQKAAMANPAKIAKQRAIADLLDGYEGGKFSEAGFQIASALNSAGIKVDPRLPNKEVAKSFTNEAALDLRSTADGNGMPGQLSNSDRDYLREMVARFDQTDKGRKMLVEARVKLLEREMLVAKMARQYRQKHGKIDDNFYGQLQEWANRNSVFGLPK